MKRLGFFLLVVSIPINIVAGGLMLAQDPNGKYTWIAGLALWGTGMLLSRADTKEDN